MFSLSSNIFPYQLISGGPIHHFASLYNRISAPQKSTHSTNLVDRKEHEEDFRSDFFHLELLKDIVDDPSFSLIYFKPIIKEKTLPWVHSHTSCNTFFENKYGFKEELLTKPNKPVFFCDAVMKNLLKRNFSYSGQVRTFKSRQQRSMELTTPTITNRLKAKLGMKVESGSNVFKSVQSPESKAKIKALLADQNLTEEEKQRIKISFAEGYMAAEPGRPQGRFLGWLKVMQQILGITVFAALLFSLLGVIGGSIFRVPGSSMNEVHPEEITITFEDVRGVEEAKQELRDIVEFLKNPSKFQALGGKLPKGVLLVGPPGTGKTLLARAVAGEAGVPFFHAAGPEFDEVLVGQGARRVRDLFKAAKIRSPCVIFIDEIDSIGSKRSNSVLHPYANQTINQLLSEMDGFRQNEGVIVLGATNRRDDLDKALMRPGRFDVEVQVPVPDFGGRKEILDYYLGKVKVGPDVDLDILARGTTGFTGADLENLVNQGAVKAAIEEALSVHMKHLEYSRDKIIMGPEKKSRIPDEDANLITAYHEGGHTLVAYYTKDAHPLHKVTIMPRGNSLGHTASIPEKEQYHITKSQMLAMMDTLMGGRAAEELIFGVDKITSGAASDLKQATSLATHMVKEWGMSDKIGLRSIVDDSNTMIKVNDLGPSTSETIDSEIRRLLQESYERAKNILKTHTKEHKLLAEALLKYETLDAEAIKAILNKNTERP